MKFTVLTSFICVMLLMTAFLGCTAEDLTRFQDKTAEYAEPVGQFAEGGTEALKSPLGQLMPPQYVQIGLWGLGALSGIANILQKRKDTTKTKVIGSIVKSVEEQSPDVGQSVKSGVSHNLKNQGIYKEGKKIITESKQDAA